jgi:probable HAF family extracellular repeat protein
MPQTGMTDLGVLPGATVSVAQAVSSDGLTIVGFSDHLALGPHAVRWRPGLPMQDLGPIPGGNYTQAFAVSRDGTWVVGEGNAPGGTRTFRWSGTTGVVNLGGLPTSNSAGARAVSGDGRVVVGYSDSDETLTATIWTPDSMLIDLKQQLIAFGAVMDGWTLVAAVGASEDGKTIVGTGAGTAGQRAWVARLPVLPCIANCDNSTGAPVLNAGDFQCFLNSFSLGQSRANCDGSTAYPQLNAMDFICFMTKFQAGCP